MSDKFVRADSCSEIIMTIASNKGNDLARNYTRAVSSITSTSKQSKGYKILHPRFNISVNS